MEQKVMSAAQKGLFIGLGLVLISVVMYIAIPDIGQQQKLGWVMFVIMLASIAWAGYKYSQDMGGNVTFGKVFGHCFQATAVMTIIMVAYFILSVTLIFPEMKDKAAELAMKQMSEQGQLTETQMQQAVEMQQKYFLPFGIAGQLVFSLIIGAIGGLIGGLIAKKNPNPTPFQ